MRYKQCALAHAIMISVNWKLQIQLPACREISQMLEEFQNATI